MEACPSTLSRKKDSLSFFLRSSSAPPSRSEKRKEYLFLSPAAWAETEATEAGAEKAEDKDEEEEEGKEGKPWSL
jgi:hypothetical protein